MSKTLIKEIFLLRALACTAVVIIHSINSMFANFGIRKVLEYMDINNIMFVIQILLMFGTPMFVFISEFILSASYRGKPPEGFYIRRIKFLLLPYVAIGFFSCLVTALKNKISALSDLITIIYEQFALGYFHGYFVLIIFQFYVLHFIFVKYIDGRFPAKMVILLSILLNFLYLYYFNFIEPSPRFPFHLVFIAWISYFSIAYYCGKNFDSFKLSLKKYKVLILASTFLSALLVLILCYSGILTYIQSKRVDIMIYTIALAFFMFYIGLKLRSIPRFLVKISQYSFGIYLLHPFFQMLVEDTFGNVYFLQMLVLYIVVATIAGLLFPIIVMAFLNKFKFGPYIIGKTGINAKAN